MSESLEPAPEASDAELAARVEALGRVVGEREAAHVPGLERARSCADLLHARVARAVERFHDVVSATGAPHLRVELSKVRIDDKHLRAVEFELSRGRHRAIVVAKSLGEVTFVGPFRAGKVEGPCQSFPIGEPDEIQRALGVFLERFLEEAATP